MYLRTSLTRMVGKLAPVVTGLEGVGKSPWCLGLAARHGGQLAGSITAMPEHAARVCDLVCMQLVLAT